MTISMTFKAGVSEVLLYGEIKSDAAANFDAELKRLRTPGRLHIRINSPGGDVFQGHAIFNILTRHPAHKVVFVDGLAASMASLIAMAGDKVVMAANSMLMIHDPSGLAAGSAEDMHRMGKLLTDIREGMIRTYAGRSKQSPNVIARFMSEETWFTAEEAVRAGFADVVEGEVQAAAIHEMAGFDLAKFRRPAAPKSIAELSATYWSSRSKKATTAGDTGDREAIRSDAPDLAIAKLDVEGIWARRRAVGGTVARMTLTGEAE